MKRQLWRWGPAVLIMAIIFLASAQPKADLPDFAEHDFSVKKSAHAVVFGALAVAMLRGLSNAGPTRWRHLVGALCLTVLYAASDEYHQTYVAGREGKLFDVGVDAVGATAGLALRHWIWPRVLPVLRRLLPSQTQSETRRR